MPLHSSSHRYGTLPAAIHWLSALAVILMLASGIVMDNEDDLIGAILPYHFVLGMVLVVLTIFRIVWWLFLDRYPEPVSGLGKAQEWASRLVHLGLYLTILIMVGSGIGMVVLTGAAPQIFGGLELPEFDEVEPYDVHGAVWRVLLVLAILHIAAALWHHFIRRDGLISRMRLG